MLYAFKNSNAVYLLKLFLFFMNNTASSTKCSGIPLAIAILRACKVICPFYIPSLAKALKAAKLDANPTETIISANF